MTQKQVETLIDFIAFIFWGLVNQQEFNWILSNLSHDIGGILRDEDCLSPRTGGYCGALIRTLAGDK